MVHTEALTGEMIFVNPQFASQQRRRGEWVGLDTRSVMS